MLASIALKAPAGRPRQGAGEHGPALLCPAARRRPPSPAALPGFPFALRNKPAGLAGALLAGAAELPLNFSAAAAEVLGEPASRIFVRKTTKIPYLFFRVLH